MSQSACLLRSRIRMNREFCDVFHIKSHKINNLEVGSGDRLAHQDEVSAGEKKYLASLSSETDQKLSHLQGWR